MSNAIFYSALSRLGYKKKDYGYKRESECYTHWITIFDDKIEGGKISCQFYSYLSDDPECSKCYDTGVIIIPRTQVFDLIQMFKENFK